MALFRSIGSNLMPGIAAVIDYANRYCGAGAYRCSQIQLPGRVMDGNPAFGGLNRKIKIYYSIQAVDRAAAQLRTERNQANCPSLHPRLKENNLHMKKGTGQGAFFISQSLSKSSPVDAGQFSNLYCGRAPNRSPSPDSKSKTGFFVFVQNHQCGARNR